MIRLNQTGRTLTLFLTSLTLTLALGACVTGTDPALTESFQAAGDDPGKLLIVDCLLPGQVRKLGTSATYITARRPIKTTIGLCEIRGGEYIAYDRADLSTALRFWLAPAESGDPQAQANVGEIYERGLGVAPDYAQAAVWYRKAAEQGLPRAQINLGHLYERGLGVPQDKTQALNWYRAAAGLSADELVFTSSLQDLRAQALASDQAVSAARQEAASARAEADRLRAQLRDLQSRLQQQNQQERSIRNELDKARQALLRTPQPVAVSQRSPQTVVKEVVKLVPVADDTQVRALKSELAKQIQEQSRIKQEAELLQQRLAAEASGKLALREQLAQLEQQLAASKKEKQQLTQNDATIQQARMQQLSQAQQDLQAARQALQQHADLLQSQASTETEQLRQALADSEARIAELQQTLTTSRDQLVSQADLDVQRANLMRARQQLDATRQQIEQQQRVLAQRDDAEVRQLTEQLRAQSEALKNKEAQIQELSEKLNSSAEKIAQASGQIEALEQETETVKQTIRVRGEVPSESPVAQTEEPRFAGLDFGRYHALVIGNNNYANMEGLKTAVSDARAIAEVLRSRYGFKVQLLVNATRKDILSALNKYREQLGESDNFLVYYAGHGKLDRANDRGHWLPVDAEANDPTNWISNTSLTDIINAMLAKHVMVIADSCYSGSLTRSVSTALGTDATANLQEKWLRKMITLRSRTVLTSGGLQPVLDSGGGNHSIFAKELLQALRSNDNVLEGPLLYSQVARRVKTAATRLGYDQTPEYAPINFAGDLGAPFFFRPQA
ncbi:MAG: caspase family protein [Gammaproteobacteria bacterium]